MSFQTWIRAMEFSSHLAIPSPLSSHFLGSPSRKTALLTEGCQKNTAKLLRPSAVNRSHCWAEGHAKTTLSWSPKGAPRRLPLHSDCVESTEARCLHRNRQRGRFFVCWLIRSTQIWNPSSMYILVCSTHSMSMGQKCKKPEKGWRKQGHFVWRAVFLECSEVDSAVFRQCFCIFRSKSSTYFDNHVSHVLWNMLEGSSARVLQCSPLPTDTGAVFNSFSKQSCLHTNGSLSPYLCPAGCFREILFKQARTCHWNQLNFSDISV